MLMLIVKYKQLASAGPVGRLRLSLDAIRAGVARSRAGPFPITRR
jgi:hypothetical protein